MHLFVDENGNPRSVKELSDTITHVKALTRLKLTPAVIKGLAGNLNSHSPESLDAMWGTIGDIINNKGSSKLVIVNSGDVEAYGHSGDDAIPFPAFNFLNDKINSFNNDIEKYIGIFGNHDVWMGSPLHLLPKDTEKVVHELRNRNEFSEAMPTQDILSLNSFRIEFYRLNTVCATWPINTFAVGKLQTDYPIRIKPNQNYTLSSGQDPINELIELSKASSLKYNNENAIRVLIMHHPPHFFTSNHNFFDLISGKLINRRPFISALKKMRFHAIFAGHRHAINPPENSHPLNGQTQKPLPENTIQLVAGSATQKTNSHNSGRPSFSLYELTIDDSKNELTIERFIYKHLQDLDQHFTCEPKETIVNGLKIN